MKKLLTGFAFVLLVLLAVAQLIPVERMNPPAKLVIPAPPTVHTVLERSCYDCHSNRTRWPWYSQVAPVSWFVTRHVRHARDELNLTEWPLLESEAQQYYLGEMKKQIEEEAMPLDSYLLLHWGARLSEAERGLLLTWIDEEIDLLTETGWP